MSGGMVVGGLPARRTARRITLASQLGLLTGSGVTPGAAPLRSQSTSFLLKAVAPDGMLTKPFGDAQGLTLSFSPASVSSSRIRFCAATESCSFSIVWQRLSASGVLPTFVIARFALRMDVGSELPKSPRRDSSAKYGVAGSLAPKMQNPVDFSNVLLVPGPQSVDEVEPSELSAGQICTAPF